MAPIISVIVPNYQGKKIFPDCIGSLLKQNFPSYEIVFVDDGSTDGSYDLAKELYGKVSKVRLFRQKENTGYVGACNRGFRETRGKYIVLIGNDSKVKPDWLNQMYSAVKGKKKTVSSAIVYEDSTREFTKRILKEKKWGTYSVWEQGFAQRRMTKEEIETGLVEVHTAGSLIFPRSAIKGDLYVEKYFAYGEDIDLAWRLRTRGYKITANLNAPLDHWGSYTRKHSKSFNKRAIYHGTKNQIVNFLVFWEVKNIIRLFIPYSFFQALKFLRQPAAWGLRLKSYWWVFTNLPFVLKHRKRRQIERTQPDSEILRMMSYKFTDNYITDIMFANRARSSFINKLLRLAVNLLNSALWLYCFVLRIKTFEFLSDDKS